MKRASSFRWARSALTLAAALTTTSASAAVVPVGFDYFQTVQPTSFAPLGGLNPLAGVPIGPGLTDTIVQRQSSCTIDLNLVGSQCTIPIEMLALSLMSTVNPAVRVRESPTLASAGAMTLTSDGSGNGGSFDSFFDVFVELSSDNGTTWQPPLPSEHLESFNTPWNFGSLGFFVPFVTEASLLAQHTGRGIRVPEPGMLSLVGAALAALGLRRRGNR